MGADGAQMRSNRVRVKMVLLATIASVASVSGTAWATEDPDGGDGGCPQGIASETKMRKYPFITKVSYHLLFISDMIQS